MDKQQLIDHLTEIKYQLGHADDVSLVRNEWTETIGAILVAVEKLREVVQDLVEREVTE